MEQEKEIQVVYDNTIEATEYWERTPLLRWSKRNNLFGPKTPVLQQVWQSNKGKQEWRDVPEED
jgi:hypothetical protein